MGNSIAAASWVPGRAALASQQADRTADQTRVARAAAAAPRGHPSIATQQTPRYTCGPSNLRARRTMNLLKWIDLPPVWLIGTLGAAFGLDRMLPGLGLGFDPLGWLGQALVAAGLGAMGLGAFELVRHRTTFIPRRKPSHFVRQGIFRVSRNPIYLGDALVLTGAILHWDVLPALVLVPAFMALITRRFILGEEAGLIEAFGRSAEAWFARVRRWL